MACCCSWYGLMAETCLHGNAPVGFVKDREILQMLCDYSLLKSKSAP
jgi:hypothetical protein